jgi:hypothetical protein
MFSLPKTSSEKKDAKKKLKNERCWILAGALHIFAEKSKHYESNTP